MSLFSKMDSKIINTTRAFELPFARLAFFVVYFWFGILKLFDASPANPLVDSLLQKTLPFMTFGTFIMLLGVYELIIGISFLIPRLSRVSIFLLIPHLIVTVMPLILLPAITWQSWFIPTLEGQYIIKNILIIALALEIAGSLRPMKSR